MRSTMGSTMKMKALRALRVQAPRRVRRRPHDLADATVEPDPGPSPEEVFDRATGPFGPRHAHACDEET